MIELRVVVGHRDGLLDQVGFVGLPAPVVGHAVGVAPLVLVGLADGRVLFGHVGFLGTGSLREAV